MNRILKKLAESILKLTDSHKSDFVEIMNLDFMKNEGEDKRIIFSSKKNGELFGVLNKQGDLIFGLDSKIWERLFRYFVLMSWDKKTYYLNAYENCLDDYVLRQECNFICSSEH